MGDIASVEFKFRRKAGDHLPHEDTGDEHVHFDAEKFVEDRLRKPRRSGSVISPLETLLAQIPLIGQRQRAFLGVTDDAHDSWSSMSVVGLRSTDTDVGNC